MDLTQAYRQQLQQIFAMFSDELAKASVTNAKLKADNDELRKQVIQLSAAKTGEA